MSFLSRIFGRKDAEDGLFGLGLNSETGGVTGLPAADEAATANLSSINTGIPSTKGRDAGGATRPTDAGSIPPQALSSIEEILSRISFVWRMFGPEEWELYMSARS
jgi:hypothetical protein